MLIADHELLPLAYSKQSQPQCCDTMKLASTQNTAPGPKELLPIDCNNPDSSRPVHKHPKKVHHHLVIGRLGKYYKLKPEESPDIGRK